MASITFATGKPLSPALPQGSSYFINKTNTSTSFSKGSSAQTAKIQSHVQSPPKRLWPRSSILQPTTPISMASLADSRGGKVDLLEQPRRHCASRLARTRQDDVPPLCIRVRGAAAACPCSSGDVASTLTTESARHTIEAASTSGPECARCSIQVSSDARLIKPKNPCAWVPWFQSTPAPGK